MSERMLDVLLLDDSNLFRQHTAAFIRRHGFGVVEAVTGDEALALVRECDIALLDIDVPGKSGLQVSREVAQLAPYIRRIVISAVPELQDEARKNTSAYDAYCDKPLLNLAAFVDANMRGEDVWPRLPFGRAANKLDTALKEFGQCLAGADVGCQPAAYLAGIRLFAKYYAWHAALTPAERRFAFMIAHALKGLSFIPSQPDRPYRLVAPTGEIIAIIGELVDSASIRDAGAAESACEALERLDIVIWPQIGEDAGDYEALMDTDDDEQEQDEQQEE